MIIGDFWKHPAFGPCRFTAVEKMQICKATMRAAMGFWNAIGFYERQIDHWLWREQIAGSMAELMEACRDSYDAKTNLCRDINSRWTRFKTEG